jgi:hypothetical protein
VDGATSISTILLIDVEMQRFSPYKYVPIPWAKHTKTTVREAPSLRNLSCSKLEFSSILSCCRRPTPTNPPVSFSNHLECLWWITAIRGLSRRSIHYSIFFASIYHRLTIFPPSSTFLSARCLIRSSSFPAAGDPVISLLQHSAPPRGTTLPLRPRSCAGE